MTFAEAAERILSQAGKPLHFRDITERAIELKLIEVDGQTPWNSMNGTLRRLIRQQGEQVPFVSLGDGMFGLREWGLAPRRLPQAQAAPRRERRHKLLPTDYKWRTVADRVRDRLSQRPGFPLFAQMYRGLSGLFIWGLCSMASGLTLLVGHRSSFVQGLAGQFLLWGAAHSTVAYRGMGSVIQQDQAATRAEASPPEMQAQKVWYRQLLLASTAVGLLAMLFGWTMHNRREDEPRQRGTGLGLFTQGSFWLVTSLLHLWLASDRHTRD
ncbi:MAG: hypothetical protein GX552_12935 [Chloroflexi bacterium]|jgi:hypothetical protein|nr:hypothetical protein [Chloroflexota bacterium]